MFANAGQKAGPNWLKFVKETMVNRWMTEDKRIFEIFEIARALPGTFAKIMIGYQS